MLLGNLYAIIEYAAIALTYLIMGLAAIVVIPRLNTSARRIQEVLQAENSIPELTAAFPESISPATISLWNGWKGNHGLIIGQ
jgi:hypothetical protein